MHPKIIILWDFKNDLFWERAQPLHHNPPPLTPTAARPFLLKS